MMPGFVEVDCHTFYSKVWERIARDVDAVESNWAAAKKGERPILITWGYKNEETGEKVILAISHSDDEGDKHWVVESLLSRH